jgi:transposase
LPCIKLRNNARVGWKKGYILRNLSVLAQKNDLQRWKDSIVSYGKRWIAETVFSPIKRKFGEHVSSVKWNNIVNEMMLKASIYNLFMDKIMT